MKRFLLSLSLLFPVFVFAQVTPTPDKLWGKLFEDVQLKKALGDNKTFVDMVPQYKPDIILKKYAALKKKDSASLRAFVLDNFYLPVTPGAAFTRGLNLNEHLAELWNTLTRKADTLRKWSSLLPLPDSYIVPGGRFREIYYWDSYFTMQGLAASGRYDLIEEMLDNFKYLIDTYGHIPNGNRNYYLSRSQPPYFAMMVELLHNKNGDAVYKKYLPALEKEYNWWMEGANNLKANAAHRRVVKLPDGSLLNRYYDDNNAPRQESYVQDITTAKDYKNKDRKAFTNLRAGAESGWDFSSRWFQDTVHLNTVETTNIIPVDLNSLLYKYEWILSQAAKASKQEAKSDAYAKKAEKRKEALSKYCWNDKLKYFFDYDFTEKHTTDKWSLAGMLPLFTKAATAAQADEVKKIVEEKFLRDGGVVTTVYHTGQQWDAPNGWAPLQFITAQGLINYGQNDLARTIGERWMAVNERVFKATGKMLEKYNVENIHLESGGGEYPTQDGFGWTNGVYLKFYEMFKANTSH
ncbi:alpha,alpha-trehalase TreA [Flavisolibacter ginsenosidimutans]|uniref:Alpha,alpha-trehalase TreA n=1 Tax=Flavisolibacter ginsenosidimutans TaxID=661481 RepID=A0A5B8UH90_9BACT|nr:alpha,alpha-trehalase TreA [Flavisolibacter ginsenosidimutans]QEC55489.1 alpha,alpha-trehalase TreA [Flavisolibacter ginsenosidimutans]